MKIKLTPDHARLRSGRVELSSPCAIPRHVWCWLLALATFASTAGAADYTYVKVGNPAQTGSSALAMDNNGRVATTSLIRSYLFADNFFANFVEITNVNIAISTPGLVAQGLNDAGELVGRFRTNGAPANQTRGFIRRAEGTFEPFDYPGMASTSISEINNHGHLVGETRSDLTAFGLIRGFVHTNGVSAEIHFPGATLTRGYGINDAGDIVGQYQMEDAVSRPFLLRNGVYSQIVPTNAPGGLASAIAFSISDNGRVLGTYRDLANVSKTWVMRADGSFEYPVLPGTGRVINNAGQIAGSFVDTNNANATTPFVATPFVPVNYVVHRMALTNSAGDSASKINEFGQITGSVDGTDGVTRGYLFSTASGDELERAGYPGSDYTEWGGINSSGTLSGYYADPADPTFSTYRAFIRDTNGVFTNIDWSGDTNFNFTVEINEPGQVAGGSATNGWVRDTNGSHNAFVTPGYSVNTAWGINDHGLVVGVVWPGFFDTPNGLIYDTTDNTVTIWNYPGAAQTSLYGINNRGDIVGEFKPNLVSANVPFVRWADGTTQVLTFPGLAGVRVYDINDERVVVGRYKDAANKNRSFYATPAAPLPEPLAFTFETLDIEGGTDTLLSDIRNDGTLVGRYKDGGGISQGFVQEGTNRTVFNVTGTTATFPGGIDSFGRVAGFYRDATNPEVQHGFVRDTNGVITTIDGPGQTFTYAWRINDAGQVNGYWFEDPFFITSFRRATNGTLTTNLFAGSPVGTVTRGMNEAGHTAGWKWDENFTLQGVIFAGGTTNVFTVAGWEHTLPGDINNFGEIAGTVNNGFTNTAGFFRRANGDTVIFNPPGAVEVEVFGLNDLGQVVGEYADAGGARHGFIAHPAAKLGQGHTDVGVAFEDGAFDLHIHDEETDTEYAPGGAVLCVLPAAEQPIPDTAALSFLGRPGYSTWILPAVQNTNLLFLGFGAEEVEAGVFVGDVLRMELVSVVGAGDFAVFAFDGFGNPVIHMNSGDGISASDFFPLTAGGHTDLNWAFSAPGTYRIGYRARGTLVDGNQEVVSEIAYYTFVVPEAQLAQPPEPEAGLLFNIVNLGTLGGPSSFALDVNESRQVTGNSRFTNANTRLHAFVWGENTITDIGYLTNGVEFSRGYAINDAGVIVGESDNNISKAFLWDGTNMVDIGTLGGASAVAHDINNAGEVVGASSNGSASRPYKRLANGTFVDLGTLLGTTNSSGRAWGINEAGDAVGLSRNAANTTSQATLWSGGGITALGSLNGGTNFSQAYAINDSNVVVGSSVAGKVSPTSLTDLTHAFVWTNGVMVDLGAHPWNTNYIHSEAKDVNNAGEIVGYAAKFSGSPTSGGAAMLWRDGQAMDLNTLVSAGSGWILQSAEGINDLGDITGYGSYQGQTRAFLLVRATRLISGHTDIGMAFEDGAWDLHVHAEDTDTEYAPAEALLTVPPLAQTVVPTNASYSFLGAAGSPTWVIPQVQNPKLLFLGFGAEEIESGLFVGDSVTMKLKSMEGPGAFSVFSIDGFGVPVVHMNSGDGIDTNDVKSIVTGSHEDFAWAFSAPGYYRVNFEACGTLVAGNEFSTSGDVTYFFEVIPVETRFAINRSGGNATISFVTQDGLTYQLESAPTVTGPWTDEGAAFLGTGREKNITVPASGAGAFFRINASVRN